MTELHLGVALCLLLTMAGGLVRIWRGPAALDRMLAAQLMGTTGAGILVLLAETPGLEAARDVALVLALLAAMTTLAFLRGPWLQPTGEAEEED